MLRVVEDPECTWRIFGAKFLYIPRVTDEVLDKVAREKLPARTTYLIVPDDHDRLLDLALTALLRKRTPTVMGFQGFIALRLLFSSLDVQWSHEDCIGHFVHSYNQRAQAVNRHDLLIEIP